MKKFLFPALLLALVANFSCQKASAGELNGETTTPTSISTGNTDIKVMSFNIRYDNSGDGANVWKKRRNRVANAIKFYAPDILGAQEVLDNQYTFLKNELPEYASIGVGRDDGKTRGEYNPLFFRKDRFTLLDKGVFWLSATPEEVSKGWDGACNRLATWAILRDNHTGKQVFALNTHLDHVGQTARREGVNLILNRAKQYAGSSPIIITGDFNAVASDNVIQNMKNGGMKDSRDIAKVKYGPAWSFHDWKGYDYEWKSLIDYVWTDGQLNVKSSGVLAETEDGKYLSDHCPILTTFEYK